MRNTIDKFYTDNYNLLVSAAKRRITQLKKSIEPESLVSSSYLYLVGKSDTIQEDEKNTLTTARNGLIDACKFRLETLAYEERRKKILGI